MLWLRLLSIFGAYKPLKATGNLLSRSALLLEKTHFFVLLSVVSVAFVQKLLNNNLQNISCTKKCWSGLTD